MTAVPFDTGPDTATALRWGLALASVALAVPLWMRHRLATIPERSASVLRAELLALTAVPCLLLGRTGV